MKFANRYELSESLTGGVVETFTARDVTSGNRVLVHIFESPERPLNLPTIEWLLKVFGDLAPAPCELVIDAGRYDGTSFAYLVMRMPEESTLKRWVSSYETLAKETTEMAIRPDSVTKRDEQSGGSDVSGLPLDSPRVFQAAKAENNAGSPRDPISIYPNSPERFGHMEPARMSTVSGTRSKNTGSFTSQFLSGFSGGAETSASEPRAPSRLEPSSNPSPSPDREAQTIKTKLGDFTRFFQGPFSGEPSPDIHREQPSMVESGARTGEFTKIFGPRESSSEISSDTIRPNDDQSLTQMLAQPTSANNNIAGYDQSEPISSKETVEPRSSPGKTTAAWKRPIGDQPPTPEPKEISHDPIVSETTSESNAQPPASDFAAGYDQENATHLFSGRNTPQRSTLADGPSEYTMIISSGRTADSLEPPIHESAPNRAGTNAGTPFTFPTSPAAPPFPAAPGFPAAPRFGSMPAASSAPKVPQPPATPPAPVSYWPLILTMTVLFFIAVILVMYFALKH